MMNEIKNIDLTENLSSEGEGELLTTLKETKEEINYFNEIEKMLTETRALKNNVRQINALHQIPEVHISALETAEQYLLKYQQSPDIFQDNPEYYDAITKDHSALMFRVGTVIKTHTSYGYISLDENETTEELRKTNELQQASAKKIESYPLVKTVCELRRIKDEWIDTKVLFGVFLCKNLVLNKEHFNLQNHEALKRLELEKECWNELESIYKNLENPSELNAIVTSVIRRIHKGDQSKSFDLKKRVDYLYSVVTTLLENFKDEEITITTRVRTIHGIIDLIIRTADGRYFAVLLRSNGDSRVKWREDRQLFYAVGKRGNSDWSGLELLGDELNRRMLSLKEEKNPLLGVSSAERKKVFTKVIVLMGSTRLDPKHNLDHMVDFGRTIALRMMRGSTYYLVDEKNFTDFLRKPSEK
jgi:hypothetical protein